MSAPWDFLLFSMAACVATLLTVRWLARPHNRTLALGLLAIVLAVGGWYVGAAGRRTAAEVERLVSAMAPTYALEIERLGHAELPLEVAPDDPRYLALIEAEKRWLKANPEVADIYTFRRRPDGKIVLFVDSETDYDKNGVIEGERERRTEVGEVYPQRGRALLDAFAGRPAFDGDSTEDRWGVWISSFVPLYDGSGAVEGVLGVDYDAASRDSAITRARLGAMAGLAALIAGLLTAVTTIARLRRASEELGRRNAELSAARDAALAASQAKSRFLANVSHELRTPLHVFLGMNELMLSSSLEDRQRKHAETARRAAEGLLGMVDDLLDYAQLEGGRLSSDQLVFDLADLVQAAVESQRAVAASKGLSLEAEIDEGVHLRILSDPRRVRQILRHLIGNAIKFTDRGGVRVRALVRPLADSRRVAVLEVIDSGIGVDADRRAEIFESFSQIDPSSTRRHGGTGIGLALSKALAERLGGTLEFEPATSSGQARGSTFRLVFPIRELADFDAAPSPSPSEFVG